MSTKPPRLTKPDAALSFPPPLAFFLSPSLYTRLEAQNEYPCPGLSLYVTSLLCPLISSILCSPSVSLRLVMLSTLFSLLPPRHSVLLFPLVSPLLSILLSPLLYTQISLSSTSYLPCTSLSSFLCFLFCSFLSILFCHLFPPLPLLCSPRFSLPLFSTLSSSLFPSSPFYLVLFFLFSPSYSGFSSIVFSPFSSPFVFDHLPPPISPLPSSLFLSTSPSSPPSGRSAARGLDTQ